MKRSWKNVFVTIMILASSVASGIRAEPVNALGAGTYDDSNPAWIYNGSWSTYNGTGPYASTMHYTNATGATATFAFQGPARFILTFTKSSNRSNILVSVDGGAATAVPANNATTLWQQTYTSDMYLDNNTHTVVISTPGDGHYIDVDAVQIVAPPPTMVAGNTYDDAHAGWIYNGSWLMYNSTGPYAKTMHYTNTTGATATFAFQGPAKFTLTFTKSSNRSNILVSVDGGAAILVPAYNATTLWQQTYTSGMYLDNLVHTVTITTPGDGHYIDVDAVKIVAPSLMVAGNTYDDMNGSWIYSGTWLTYNGPGPYAQTMHYTNETGAAATFVFQGPARFILTFTASSNRSNIMVSVDGGPPTAVPANNATTLWQQTYARDVSGTGTHIVRISTPGTGHYIDVDAVRIE